VRFVLSLANQKNIKESSQEAHLKSQSILIRNQFPF
jgi:hypothetical protein